MMTAPDEHPRSLLFSEAAEAADSVQRQADRNAVLIERLAAELRTLPPRAVVTCARGSSDHAATFGRYLIETRLGFVAASLSPSVSSIYGVRPRLEGCLFIGISQSGASPDLLAAADAAREAGARVLALVNAEQSPLATAAHHVVPLCAGPEHSVAATKSFIAALYAMAQLIAAWSQDAELARALGGAPEMLAKAWRLDWSDAMLSLRDREHVFTLARGHGLGVAQEAALKMKETCALHAEAFSSAEVRHGPMTLLGPAVPAMFLPQRDAGYAGQHALAGELALRGVPVLFPGDAPTGAQGLPALEAHPVLQPLLLIQSFYRALNRLSFARGLDPDRPPQLRKVTQTL